MGVKRVTTSPYNLQPSHADRFNRNLRAALIAYHRDAHDTWDQQLPWLQLAFNTAEHESTKSTPFAVIFPFRAGSSLLIQWTINELMPVKLTKGKLEQKWAKVRQSLCKSRANLEHRYNQNRVAKPFKIDELVYYKNHPISNVGRHIAAKLIPRYKGPFKIDRFLTPVTVRLIMPTTVQFVTKAHVSLLKGEIGQRD
jgi:hypothetical protein